MAARHDATGELAALTEIAVDPADPGWGIRCHGVTRQHRGHRLGLLVKIAMVEWLRWQSRRWNASIPGTRNPTGT